MAWNRVSDLSAARGCIKGRGRERGKLLLPTLTNSRPVWIGIFKKIIALEGRTRRWRTVTRHSTFLGGEFSSKHFGGEEAGASREW